VDDNDDDDCCGDEEDIDDKDVFEFVIVKLEELTVFG
jgi:hypothetical protein